MPCPFPGMDPFLEMPPFWGDFAPRLLTAISNSLLPRLLPRYDVRIEGYLVVTHEEERLHRVQSDVTISTAARWSTGTEGAVAVAEPTTVELDYPEFEPITQRHLRLVHRRFALLLAGLALLACGVLAAGVASAQDLLQSLRDDVRSANGDPALGGGADGDDNDSKRHRGGHCDGRSNWLDQDDDEAEESFWLGVGKLTLWTVTSPLWLPRTLIDDTTLDPGCFARYPYRCDLDGYMAPDAEFMRQQYPWLESDRYAWMVRLRGEYGGDFDNLSRAGGQLLFDTASRWGVDSEANYLHEQLPADRCDQLWLGDANVVYRFAQSPQLQMRTGLGLNWLSDEFGSDFGFNFTYGGDFFPADPWIVSAEIDWGKLGRAGRFHGRATVGVHFHRFEVYTGYDYLDVGDTQINSAVSGVRIWY